MIQYNFLLVRSSLLRSLISDQKLLLLLILQLLSHVVTVNTNAISCAYFLQAGLLHFPVLRPLLFGRTLGAFLGAARLHSPALSPTPQDAGPYGLSRGLPYPPASS